MKRVLTVCISIILLCGLTACVSIKDDSFYNIQSVFDEFTNIYNITVINGTTGDKIEITDEAKVKEIFDAFSQLSIKDTEQPKEDWGGYGYNISFYNGKDKVLGVVYGGRDKLFINGHLYIVEDMSVIQSSIDYFDEYIDKA